MYTQPVSADATSPMELREGDQGAAVRELQSLLRNWGYLSVNVDGSFGARTKVAVVDFQRRNGLVADGAVGSRTWAVLRRNPNTQINLKEGDSGEQIKQLQTVLIANDYSLIADGQFGARTKESVMSFQRRFSTELAVTGVVDNQTWQALWREVLNEGDSGEPVRRLQQRLRERGYTVNVTGTFDAVTKTAVMSFQRQAALTIDGIVGRRTKIALNLDDANAPAINLVDVARFYNPAQAPHQTYALQWLTNNCPVAVLNTFATLWRNEGAVGGRN